MPGRSPLDIDELVIMRGQVVAGTLRRTTYGCEFEFATDFLADSQYEGLSFGMPKSKPPLAIHGTNLHPFFAGLLPEGLRLKALITKTKTSPDGLFSLFASAGAHVIGDVHAEPAKSLTEGRETLIRPKLKDIDFYQHFRQLLEQNSYAAGEDAIAGVQDKVSAATISFPLNIAKANKFYILKLNPRDKPTLIYNELQCMTLARRCGIEAAKVKIVKDKLGQEGLLVERFDRIWNGIQNKIEMLHQEDACQFLNRYPSDKYYVTFSEVASALAEVATASHASLVKLLRLYCFSYLIANGDLHAKNISVLTSYDLGLTDLSPAYDLISTLPYGDQKMALKIDGKDDNIKRKALIEFGARFGLQSKIVEKMLDELTKKFEANAGILKSIPIGEKQMTHLLKTIEKRLSDLKE